MLHASHTSWKCLVWVAVLLSPIHAVQGVMELCECSARSRLPHRDVDAGSACCHHQDHACDNHYGSHYGSEEKRDLPGTHQHEPVAPCQCPASCFCQKPERPQLPSGRPVQVVCSVDMVCEAVDVTGAFANSCSVRAVTDDAVPFFSAQQMCACLCRFLA